jgi:hypothetical protein
MARLSRRLTSAWYEYDSLYQEWKRYKKKQIDKHTALEIVEARYGARKFFLLYPLYKILKPLRNLKISVTSRLGHTSKTGFEPSLIRPAHKLRGGLEPIERVLADAPSISQTDRNELVSRLHDVKHRLEEQMNRDGYRHE